MELQEAGQARSAHERSQCRRHGMLQPTWYQPQQHWQQAGWYAAAPCTSSQSYGPSSSRAAFAWGGAGCAAVMYASYPAPGGNMYYPTGTHHAYPVAVIYPSPGWMPADACGYTDAGVQQRRHTVPATRHDRRASQRRQQQGRAASSDAGNAGPTEDVGSSGQAGARGADVGTSSGCAACSQAGSDSVALQPQSCACCDAEGQQQCGGASSSGSPATSTCVVAAAACVTGWGDLTAAIIQGIVLKLADCGVKNLRLVCRHWRAVIDHDLESLTPTEPHTRALVLRFPNLKVLHLTNCANVRNRDLQTISSSGLALHTLTLGDDSKKPWVTNEGLACVAQITTLTSLSLHDCNGVTNNGIAALTRLQRLASLSLQRCGKLTSAALAPLQHHVALTSLQLRGCRLTGKGLAPLLQLQLVSLHLGDVRVRDEGMTYVARMTTLQELHVDHEEVSDAGVSQLTSLTRLESLALRDCRDVSGDALNALIPALPCLRSLDLYRQYTMTDVQLSRCMEYLGALTFLDLRGTPVTEGGVGQLTRLTSLQKLCLSPTQECLWSPFLGVVSSLTQLISLSINNCTPVTLGQLDSLQRLKLLRELDLSHDNPRLEDGGQLSRQQPINPTAIQSMACITTLTSIDLSRRPVHQEHLSTLAERLPRLHSLIIVGCPVASSEVQMLQRRFPDLVIHRKPLCETSSCSSSDHGYG